MLYFSSRKKAWLLLLAAATVTLVLVFAVFRQSPRVAPPLEMLQPLPGTAAQLIFSEQGLKETSPGSVVRLSGVMEPPVLLTGKEQQPVLIAVFQPANFERSYLLRLGAVPPTASPSSALPLPLPVMQKVAVDAVIRTMTSELNSFDVLKTSAAVETSIYLELVKPEV